MSVANRKNQNSLEYRVCSVAMEDKKKFEDLLRWGREEIRLAENEMPGIDGFERRVCPVKALEWGTYYGLFAHDYSNSGID